jgi:hypothetical protein
MIIEHIAQTVPQIKEAAGEGSWITTGFITALLAGMAGIVTAAAVIFRPWTKAVSIKEQPVKVETTSPPPPVTWQEVRDLKDRVKKIEEHVDEIKSEQGKQFVLIMNNVHASELRLTDKLETSTRPIHDRIDALLGMMTKRKNSPRGKRIPPNQA